MGHFGGIWSAFGARMDAESAGLSEIGTGIRALSAEAARGCGGKKRPVHGDYDSTCVRVSRGGSTFTCAVGKFFHPPHRREKQPARAQDSAEASSHQCRSQSDYLGQRPSQEQSQQKYPNAHELESGSHTAQHSVRRYRPPQTHFLRLAVDIRMQDIGGMYPLSGAGLTSAGQDWGRIVSGSRVTMLRRPVFLWLEIVGCAL